MPSEKGPRNLARSAGGGGGGGGGRYQQQQDRRYRPGRLPPLLERARGGVRGPPPLPGPASKRGGLQRARARGEEQAAMPRPGPPTPAERAQATPAAAAGTHWGHRTRPPRGWSGGCPAAAGAAGWGLVRKNPCAGPARFPAPLPALQAPARVRNTSSTRRAPGGERDRAPGASLPGCPHALTRPALGTAAFRKERDAVACMVTGSAGANWCGFGRWPRP